MVLAYIHVNGNVSVKSPKIKIIVSQISSIFSESQYSSYITAMFKTVLGDILLKILIHKMFSRVVKQGI